MPWSSSRPPASARGYGAAHRKRRSAALADLRSAGVGRCCLGGELISAEHIDLPNSHPRKVVLDHCDCRTGCDACGWTGYRGLACWQHNVRAAGARANVISKASRQRKRQQPTGYSAPNW